ncbi:hypothetical protein Syun_024844 [Stephania yunnanensis]|uniref:Uncharacterized protein n=1 Tax=Stephania yunnanensis TaxID=152371 RepID=A0AAP0HU64_9MAGN
MRFIIMMKFNFILILMAKILEILQGRVLRRVLQLGVAVSVHSVANDALFAGHYEFEEKNADARRT